MDINFSYNVPYCACSLLLLRQPCRKTQHVHGSVGSKVFPVQCSIPVISDSQQTKYAGENTANLINHMKAYRGPQGHVSEGTLVSY